MPTAVKQLAYNPLTMAVIAITSPIVLSFIIWVLNMTIFKKIDGVEKKVTDVQGKFQDYQLETAKTMATKKELCKLEETVEKGDEDNKESHTRLYDKIDEKADKP